jgi:ribosome maturation factor RimP
MGFFVIWVWKYKCAIVVYEEIIHPSVVFEMGLKPIFCFWVGVFMSSVQERLTDLLGPVVEALGCELWGIEYLTQGRTAVLRIFIDKEEGIGVEDCERVSRQASSVLDVEDPISSEYTLEVSSPGIDRPLFKLEQFVASVGAQVAIRLRRPFEGRRRFSGLLKSIEGDEIVLEIDNEEYLLPFELIDKANIVPQF